MYAYNTAVTDAATLLMNSDNINRTCYIHVVGNGKVAIGGAGVTFATGLLTEKHTTPLELFLPIGQKVYAICDTGATENVRVMIPDQD
jgi:hypothetical protein